MVQGKSPASFFCMWTSCFPAPVVEKTVLSRLGALATLIENQLTIICLLLGSLFFSYSLFVPIPHFFFSFTQHGVRQAKCLPWSGIFLVHTLKVSPSGHCFSQLQSSFLKPLLRSQRSFLHLENCAG